MHTLIKEVENQQKTINHITEHLTKIGQNINELKRWPYFGYIELTTEDGRIRKIYIGEVSLQNPDITIVNWRMSPFAQVFFSYKAGEDFSLDLPGGMIEGRVEKRIALDVENGQLVKVDDYEEAIHLIEQKWQVEDSEVFPKLVRKYLEGIRETISAREKNQNWLPSQLDKFQLEAVNLPIDRSILVRGEAGHGKTTVALARLQKLCKENAIPQEKTLVIVPEPGLAMFLKRCLQQMHLSHVHVSTFDDWITEQGFKVLKRIPQKICSDTPAESSTIKRHACMFEVIQNYYLSYEEKLELRIQESFFIPPGIKKAYFQAKSRPIWDRLDNMFQTLRDMHRHHQIEEKKG